MIGVGVQFGGDISCIFVIWRSETTSNLNTHKKMKTRSGVRKERRVFHQASQMAGRFSHDNTDISKMSNDFFWKYAHCAHLHSKNASLAYNKKESDPNPNTLCRTPMHAGITVSRTTELNFNENERTQKYTPARILSN